MRNRLHSTSILYTIAVLILAALPVRAVEEKHFPAAYWKQKGDTCFHAGRFAEALEFYTRALDGAKHNKDNHIYYASIGGIGNIYASMGDLKRARHYAVMGYEASVKDGDNEMQWRFATNLVGICCLMKDTKGARAFFRQQTAIPIKDQATRRYCFLQSQAHIALAEGNQQMGEYYLKQTIGFAKERRMSAAHVLAPQIDLAQLKAQQGRTDEALRIYQSAYGSLRKAGNPSFLVSVLKGMEQAYRKEGKRDSAETCRAEYLAASDSVFNAQQFNIATSKLFEYENAQTKEQIDSLVSQNKVQLATIGVFVLMLGGFACFYIALRRKTRSLQEAQRTLVEKNEELTRNDQRNKALLEQYVSMANRRDTPPHTTGAPTAAEERAKAEGGEERKRGDIRLSDEQRNRLLNSIATVMGDIGVISRADFNLATLASMVESNTKYVSWVINDAYDKNFKTLLNEHRIREACRRMADQEHYGHLTLQAIYEDLGWTSAAGFIQSFRKVNGMTPSMYQKLLRKGGEKKG